MGRVFASSKVGRRRFLQLTAGGVLILSGMPRPTRAAAKYVVGVGRESDAYVATRRALDAAGEWNSALLAGRTVLIKPNLVAKVKASTGTVTDPQVVRALVDTALDAGAAQVKIIEGTPGGNNFESCGYGFFADYDDLGRVALVDLAQEPTRLFDVPGGLAYRQMYMPELLFAPDTILVSAAKMKVHAETVVTLAVKNSFGLSSEVDYRVQTPDATGRFAMHDRGVHQATVDHIRVRPIDFAVVDGVWAMERTGPYGGDVVAFDTVVAGRNAVAVDRVCLAAMGIQQHWPYHLLLAAHKGLGPLRMSEIELRGDALEPRTFVLPDVPPVIDLPITTPATLSLAAARAAQAQPQQEQAVAISYGVNRPCVTRIEIVQTSDLTTEVVQVRLLQDWTLRAAGTYSLQWDGRDDDGALVAPGLYTARVEATHGERARNAFASAWITVLDDAVADTLVVEPALLTFVGNVNGALPPAQTLTLESSVADFAWEIATSVPWLQPAVTSGTGPASLMLAVDTTGLGQGVYTEQVTITGTGPNAEMTRIVHVKVVLSEAKPPETLADLVFDAEVGRKPPLPQTLTIANTGSDRLAWVVNQVPVWLEVSAVSGEAPSEIELAAPLDGVAAGIYLGQVTVVNAEDISVVQQASVVLRVSQPKQRLRLPYARRP